MSPASLPRAARGSAAAMLVGLLLLVGAATAQVTITVSSNMSDPCYTDPSAPSCATFQRSDADWTTDLEMLCAAMPYMIGCSLWSQCKSGEARAESPYCMLPSLVGDICVADGMGRMKGCEAHNGLCAASTVVQQCLDPGVAPNVPTTFQSKDDVDGVCTSHSMDGCQSCSSVGKMNFRDCPELLNILSKLCVSMPDMAQCAAFHTFCDQPTMATDFPKVCTQNAADGSSSALPPMKMWFHQGTRDIFLFREWVPKSTGQYIGLCIAMCVLAVFTQFLKAVRLRVEMRWSRQMRSKCVCPEPSCDAASSDPESPAPSEGGGVKASEDASASSELPPCCQARAAVPGSGGAVVPSSPVVPVSRRVPRWRSSRRGTLSCFGTDLINREQAARNFWRACFTFVVIFLDYALMLVVMTFNVGIILAVCGGFAIGALLFGHAGEQQAGRTLIVEQATKADSTGDLEAVFVEGPGCCSGGTAAAHLASTA